MRPIARATAGCCRRWRRRYGFADFFGEFIGQPDTQDFLQLQGGASVGAVGLDGFDPVVIDEGHVDRFMLTDWSPLHSGRWSCRGDILGIVEVIREQIQAAGVGSGLAEVGAIVNGCVSAELKAGRLTGVHAEGALGGEGIVVTISSRAVMGETNTEKLLLGLYMTPTERRA
jgi:hypothetical protein